MTDDSHAARNAAQLREVERQQSHGLVRSHNALIAMLDEREDVADRLLDDDQLEAMDGALDQLEAVATSIRDDDRLLDKHERLLASEPEREQLVTDGGQELATEWRLVCLDCDFREEIEAEGHPRDGPPRNVEKRVRLHKHRHDESHVVRVEGRPADRELDAHLLSDGGGYRCDLCGTAHHSRYDAMACCSDRFDDPPLLTDGGRDVDLNGECPACGNKTLWRGECAHPDCEGPAPRRVAFDGGRGQPRWTDLSAALRDTLLAIVTAPGDEPTTPDVKTVLEQWRGDELSSGTLTHRARALEKRGLIRRTKADGRTNALRLTREGEELLRRHLEHAAEVLDARLRYPDGHPWAPDRGDVVPQEWLDADVDVPKGVTPVSLEQAVDGSRTLIEVCGQLGLSPQYKGKIRVLTTLEGLYEQLESPEAGPTAGRTA